MCRVPLGRALPLVPPPGRAEHSWPCGTLSPGGGVGHVTGATVLLGRVPGAPLSRTPPCPHEREQGGSGELPPQGCWRRRDPCVGMSQGRQYQKSGGDFHGARPAVGLSGRTVEELRLRPSQSQAPLPSWSPRGLPGVMACHARLLPPRVPRGCSAGGAWVGVSCSHLHRCLSQTVVLWNHGVEHWRPLVFLRGHNGGNWEACAPS